MRTDKDQKGAIQAAGAALLFAFFVVPALANTVTVSTAADLVSAVTANNNSSAGGTVIQMNAGTYAFNSSTYAGGDPAIGLDIARPVTLTSVPGAAVTLNFANNYGIRIISPNVILSNFTIAGQYFAVSGVDVRNLFGGTLSGLVVRGLTVSTTQNGQAIVMDGVTDSIIEGCVITSTPNNGIVLERGGPNNLASNRNLVVNNSVSNTASGSGVAVQLSDYNTVAGNTFSNVFFNGVFVNGGQHNYVGQNVMDNGLTFTVESSSGRQSTRNLAVNNTIAMRAQPNSEALWFNQTANYNLSFLNEGYNAGEAGMLIFNSNGNYVRATDLHSSAYGGLVVRTDPPASSKPPGNNSIQQNYLHDHPANGGLLPSTEMHNDYGFNYIASSPSGIQTAGSINSVFYANIISNVNGAENVNTSTGEVFYLNRHFNSPIHLVYTGSSATFDSGSPTLGGNYYSDFTSANGNPSNGATPYTNIQDQNGATGVYRDNYPFLSENLGKSYSINLRTPSNGSYLAATSTKTISWSSQGCVAVDLYLTDVNGNITSTIKSNAPDYGYYRWVVPSVATGQYRVRADCKTSANNVTGKTSVGPVINITPADLILLSPQSNLMQDAGTPMQISWRKSTAIAAVDVYIRYSDTQAYSLLQAAVTGDYYTIVTPTVNSNRVSVRLAYGGYGDSTDNWFTIRGSSTGAFTAPATAANLYVGTPSLVEWVAPIGTDFVTLDLVGSSTRNLVTQLGDFSSYLLLVPDMQGTGNTLRLTFYNSAGSVLQQLSSPAQTIQNSSTQPDSLTASGGNNQSTAVNTNFGAPLSVTVLNSTGSGIPNVSVTFTAPGSGAGGSFGGSATATVLTNNAGVATSPAFTANGATGTYSVVATAGNLSTSLTLTNTAAVTSTQVNVGIFYNSMFALDYNGNGQFDSGDKLFFYVTQQAGDIAITGDWNGDGHTKIGIYRNGFWILDYNGNGVYDPSNGDKFYTFGGPSPAYVPVVGDWNGDGRTKIGYYHGGFWALDYNGNGTYDGNGAGQDRFFGFGGNSNEFPLVGDWNHNGRAKVGIFFNGTFALDYDGDGQFTTADRYYGPYVSYAAGDRPIVGDWSANGFTKVGIYRNGFWILDYNGNGVYDQSDKFYAFGGNSGEIPLIGDWNGDGRAKIGYYRNGFWALDFNGNGSFDGTGTGQDRFIAFGGNANEQPIIGKW